MRAVTFLLFKKALVVCANSRCNSNSAAGQTPLAHLWKRGGEGVRQGSANQIRIVTACLQWHCVHLKVARKNRTLLHNTERGVAQF